MEFSTIVIWVSAAIGLVIVVFAWVGSEARPGSRLGPVGWSFSQSWASNLTAILVLFSTLFAVDRLPTTPYIAKETYSALAIMFGSMVIVAPILYLATGSQVSSESNIQIQGRVWGFSLAAFVVLWAIIGQLGTTFLLSLDLGRTDLHGGIRGVIIGLASLAFLASVWQGGRSVIFTLRTLAAPTEPNRLNLEAANAPRWLMP